MNFTKRLEFAHWLRQKRKDAGYSQAKAAFALGYANPGSMKRIDSGYDPVPIKRLFDFSRVFNIPMAELLAKLKECEPEKAKEFDLLANKFSAYFLHMYKTMESEGKAKAGNGGNGRGLHMSNYQTPGYSEHPWHHKPFVNEFNRMEHIFLLTELYIIRHWNALDTILSTARHLFAKIHNITILSNFLPFLVNPLPCLDSSLSIRV